MSVDAAVSPVGRRLVPTAASVALVWCSLVSAVALGYMATGGAAARPVSEGLLLQFILLQSGLVAAAVSATSALQQRRVYLGFTAILLGLFIVSVEAVGLPLNLYACAEWLRAASAAGLRAP